MKDKQKPTKKDSGSRGEKRGLLAKFHKKETEDYSTSLVFGTQDAAAAAPRRKNWLARHKKLAAVLAVLLVAAFAVWRFLRAAVPASTVTYQYVRTTTLQKTSLENSVTATGTVAAGSEAHVTVADAAKTYTIATVNVEVGDEVQAGDVIATLDTADLQKQIELAEQSYSDDLQSAQTTYDRAVDSYEVGTVQHENKLIDLQEAIDKADETLAEAQQALCDAQDARDSAESTVNAAQSTLDSLQSAYSAAQGIASYISAYDAAADALVSAAAALDTAGSSYTTAYMNYTAAADDETRAALLPALETAARSLESAWTVYGSGAGLQAALDANAGVSAGNQRAVSATTAPDIAGVNAQLAAAGSTAVLNAPVADTLVENFKAAAEALVTQESAVTADTGMTYQQLLDSYAAAQSQLTAAQTALTQADTQLTSAETQVKTAETQLENAHDSYDTEKNSTTLTSLYQQIEDAEVRLEQAQRTPDTLTTLRDTLEDCTLTATMSGTVTALNATVGSVCGETVATIQDTDGLTVEITLSANDVSTVSTGMACTIQSDATGETEINGTLTQIDPTANEQGTFGAKVQVNTADSGLLIGIQAQVEIIQDVTEGVFVVPIDAVGTAQDGSSFVYRQTGGEGVDMTFEEVLVTTGASNDYYIEISGDTLAEGDVIRATADMTEGIETAEVEEDSALSMMPGMGDMSGQAMPDMSGQSMPDMGSFGGGADFGGGAPAGGPGGM